jgi:hypothetical protein
MRYRKLRIAWSVVWAIPCVLLIVLWVRSYFKLDYVYYEMTLKTYSMASYHGRFRIVRTDFFGPSQAKSQERMFYSLPLPAGKWRFYNDWGGQPLPSYLGFESSWLSGPIPMNVWSVVPYWFPTLACSLVALFPWLHKLRARFTLRTLLTATTLVAVVLGLIVWSVR